MSQQTSRRRPIVVDLFAGAGGLSLGFEQAGFDVVASVEIDPIHAAVHHFNFPMSVAICRSVVDVSGQLIRDQAGIGHQDIDAVCGGAPCQGFSTIGKRALDDPRNRLAHHFCRLVSELRPKYAVFENVRGLTMGAQKAFFERDRRDAVGQRLPGTAALQSLERCGPWRTSGPEAPVFAGVARRSSHGGLSARLAPRDGD